jgi:hypothetical protein
MNNGRLWMIQSVHLIRVRVDVKSSHHLCIEIRRLQGRVLQGARVGHQPSRRDANKSTPRAHQTANPAVKLEGTHCDPDGRERCGLSRRVNTNTTCRARALSGQRLPRGHTRRAVCGRGNMGDDERSPLGSRESECPFDDERSVDRRRRRFVDDDTSTQKRLAGTAAGAVAVARHGTAPSLEAAGSRQHTPYHAASPSLVARGAPF